MKTARVTRFCRADEELCCHISVGLPAMAFKIDKSKCDVRPCVAFNGSFLIPISRDLMVNIHTKTLVVDISQIKLCGRVALLRCQ